MTCSDVVLVGAGLASQRCAETLRARGFEGPIRMIGAEPHAPYDRPPLSKELLREGVSVGGAPAAGGIPRAGGAPSAGGSAAEGGPPLPLLRPPGWHEENDVDLLLGDPAAQLGDGRVRLASGATVPFGKLLVATGARARTLPGLEHALTLRSAGDAAALREHLRPGARLAIVGAGFVGLEVAATARELGVEVTVFELAPAPLARVLGPEVGDWFTRLHRAHGVDLRLGEALGDPSAYDAILVAVGAVPDTEWAGPEPWRRPNVFVAGDASGSQHWEAAVRQGKDAARAMLGLPPLPPAPDSVWSDQHGIRIHVLGRPAGTPLIEEASKARLVAWFGEGAVLAGAADLLPVARQRLRTMTTQEEMAA
jgi:NADPH-dependent 2,4-dienoyl-CoA reductase/sulfur reductase-like enzyme